VCELGRGDGKWKDLERLHDPDSFSILPIIFQHLRADLPNPQLSSAVCSLPGRGREWTVTPFLGRSATSRRTPSAFQPNGRSLDRLDGFREKHMKTPPDPLFGLVWWVVLVDAYD
jgi:hypothetical protein